MEDDNEAGQKKEFLKRKSKQVTQMKQAKTKVESRVMSWEKTKVPNSQPQVIEVDDGWKETAEECMLVVPIS